MKDPDVSTLGNVMRMKRNEDLYGDGGFISEKEADEYLGFVRSGTCTAGRDYVRIIGAKRATFVDNAEHFSADFREIITKYSNMGLVRIIRAPWEALNHLYKALVAIESVA